MVGYHMCRNEESQYWEYRAIKGTLSLLLLGFHRRVPKGPPEWKKGARARARAPSMKKAAIQSYRLHKGKHVCIRMHQKIV